MCYESPWDCREYTYTIWIHQDPHGYDNARIGSPEVPSGCGRYRSESKTIQHYRLYSCKYGQPVGQRRAVRILAHSGIEDVFARDQNNMALSLQCCMSNIWILFAHILTKFWFITILNRNWNIKENNDRECKQTGLLDPP